MCHLKVFLTFWSVKRILGLLWVGVYQRYYILQRLYFPSYIFQVIAEENRIKTIVFVFSFQILEFLWYRKRILNLDFAIWKRRNSFLS